MKYLSDRYISVYSHKGFDICTLKVAVPANGDEMGYVIDSERFSGQVFNDPTDAIAAIDSVSSRVGKDKEMGNLIQSDDLGNWGVRGLPWSKLYVGQVITREVHEKLYGCLCKLKDYEETGLSPEQVESLVE